MPTMKDVAREARVSVGTVSNVLNSLPSVKAGNRERVMAAVEKLGFRSNMAARTLRTRSTRDIGLIVPSISNPFYAEFARAVEDTAQKAGLTVFLCNDDRDLAKERQYIEALLDKNVDGIIISKPQVALSEIDKILRCCPAVMVDFEVPEDARYCIINTVEYGGISSGLELLFSYGHTRIALIDGMNETLKSLRKSEIFRRILEKHNVPLRREYLMTGNYDWKSGYLAASALLRLPEPPTAIFAINDLMAMGAMKAIQERGLRIPEDISVLGYDNIELTSLYTPALTTINFPKYEMGCRSVELLRECMRDREAGALVRRECTVRTELVIRESVGPRKGEA